MSGAPGALTSESIRALPISVWYNFANALVSMAIPNLDKRAAKLQTIKDDVRRPRKS